MLDNAAIGSRRSDASKLRTLRELLATWSPTAFNTPVGSSRVRRMLGIVTQRGWDVAPDGLSLDNRGSVCRLNLPLRFFDYYSVEIAKLPQECRDEITVFLLKNAELLP